MDDLLTDQQQAEVVRGWLRENGLWLVGGVILGLAGLVGWSQWNRYQEVQAESASVVFDNVLKSVATGRLDEARSGVELLTKDYGRSVYADQARLALAKLELDRNDPKAAADLLRTVANGASPAEIRDIARLRLARLLIFQEQGDEAIKVLAGVDAPAFAASVHEVRGDAYLALKKTDDARKEYQEALTGATTGINRGLVQAKLDSLGGALPAAEAPAEAAAATAVPAAATPPPAAAPAAEPAAPAAN